MVLRLFFVTSFALGLLGSIGGAALGQTGPIIVGQIEGVINPITVRYVERLVRDGEERGAAAVVLVINTPGGLIDSTYKIDSLLLNARVPIITYVGPSGARAASAGTFITLAGHVAAMAPATNIGAAHPVSGSGGDIEGDLRAKVENDAVAEITKIALARGKNAEWAESAVRDSVSIRDDEALRINVIDFVAADVQDLLNQADGLTVQLPGGPVRLETANRPIEDQPKNIFETILHFVVDPQIAVLLFTIGTYGIIFELSNPSLIFPGVVGGICILLALFAFGTLDANAAGVALMVFAMVLFGAELLVASGGLLTIGGIVALLIGVIIVFPSVTPTFPGFRYSVEPAVIAAVVGVTALFFYFVARVSLGYRHLETASGTTLLIGAVGVAKRGLTPSGIAHVAGEDWTAVSHDGAPIPKGASVRVQRVDGVRLIVESEDASSEGKVS